MEPEQKPQEQSFIRELVPDWRPSREQKQWAVRIAIVLGVVLGILALLGLPFGITLWDWLKLLIIPAVIAAGGLWFNRQQHARELQTTDQRAQDEALQAYLDQMGQMLVDKDRPLRESEERDVVRILARARTLTLLPKQDGSRKGTVVQFLYEARLIAKQDVAEDPTDPNNPTVLDLRGADLSRVEVNNGSWMDLTGLSLAGPTCATLP